MSEIVLTTCADTAYEFCICVRLTSSSSVLTPLVELTRSLYASCTVWAIVCLLVIALLAVPSAENIWLT